MSATRRPSSRQDSISSKTPRRDQGVKTLKIELEVEESNFVTTKEPTVIPPHSTISPNCIRSPIVTDPFPCGPADFPRQPKETKLPHTLVSSPEPIPPEAPLSGDLVHPDWTYKEELKIPINRHPRIEYEPVSGTPSFESRTERGIWTKETEFRAPPPTQHSFQQQFTRDFREVSGVFLSKTERFMLPEAQSPPSTAYTIPDQFGKSSTKKLCPPEEPFIRYNITPDPGQYSPQVVQLVKTKDKSFSKVKRFRNIKRTPGPGDYDHNTAKRPSTTIQVTRNDRSSWVTTNDSPSPAQYEVTTLPKKSYPKISRTGHRELTLTKDEHPLEFRTQHSSFIKPSFNSHYSNVGKKFRY